MTVKSCEKLEKSRVALTIETSAEEFEAAVNKAYLKMHGKINVPGFRVGKAPRKIIEKMYGAEVFYEEAVNIILPDAYEAAVKEQELEVVGYPQVELESCTKDGVVFKCTVAVYPEVKLGQYKGLEAPKAEVKVVAADVNARLKEMADRNSRLVSVERAVKKGDTADIDFEGFDNGVAFDGGKGENFDLEIGSGSFVPGFEDQLIGMKAGEEKDIDITFPENYTPELAGKPVVFHVKVNEVKEKQVPAIDDEFAKDVSEFDTLKDLKADIKKKLTAERTESAQRAFEDVLMAKVAEGIEADIPEEMVELQAERMMEQFKQQLASQGIPFEQYLKMTNTAEADFRKQAQGPAADQVKMDLAVEAIIKAEGLEASDEDVESEMKSVAEKYGMDLDTVKKYLRPEDVKEQVIREKVVKLVADSAVAVAPAEEKAELEAEGEVVEKKAAKKAPAKKPAKKDAEKDENSNDVLLSGVEFKLEKLVETTEGKTQWVVDKNYPFNSTNKGSITGITGADGKIIDNPFTNLEPGTYRLTETKAHPGYNLLAQPIVIQFTQGGECFIDGEKITDTKTFVQSDNTYTMNLTVLNRKMPELPHTGADAPSLWLLIGMPLAVAGLLIFTFRYNRKGGRRH